MFVCLFPRICTMQPRKKSNTVFSLRRIILSPSIYCAMIFYSRDETCYEWAPATSYDNKYVLFGVHPPNWGLAAETANKATIDSPNRISVMIWFKLIDILSKWSRIQKKNLSKITKKNLFFCQKLNLFSTSLVFHSTDSC